MWTLISSVIAGLFALAASTSWRDRGRNARLRTIRAEAELLHVLPEGAGKRALTHRVDVDTLAFIKYAASSAQRRLLTGLLSAAAVGFVGSGTTIVVALVNILHDPNPHWTGYASWIGAAVAALGVTAMAAIDRLIRRRDNAFEVAAEEESSSE